MKTFFILLSTALLLYTGVSAQKKNPAAKNESTLFVLGRTEKINSVVLGESRTLNIYLPEGYHPDSAKLYPVIYLLDGSANEDFIHIVGLAQFLNMIRVLPPSIIVGISNVDRKRDFTFPTKVAADLKDLPTSGGSAKFISFIEKELQPYIQQHYRTGKDKTIIGQSLGGLLATEVLLKKPQLFNNYIIISPSLWWNDESLLAEAPALLKAGHIQDAKVYISVGTEGAQMENDAHQLSDVVRSGVDKSTQVYFAPMPEENHLTILHPQCI